MNGAPECSRSSLNTIFGQAFAAIGAVPTHRAGYSPQNLAAGLLLAIPAVVLGGAVMIAGARHLPREMALMLAKLRSRPRHAAADALPTLADL